MSTSNSFSASTNKYAYAQVFTRTSPNRHSGTRETLGVWRRLARKHTR